MSFLSYWPIFFVYRLDVPIFNGRLIRVRREKNSGKIISKCRNRETDGGDGKKKYDFSMRFFSVFFSFFVAYQVRGGFVRSVTHDEVSIR